MLCWTAFGQKSEAKKISVNSVELHYIEKGEGEPLILLHGGQGDYRSWSPQIEALSPKYRVIAYSRRYNYPNDNPITSKYRSAYTEAKDLAALIRKLKLKPTHLVGTSAGALTALVLAIEQPQMVRTLVLAEPPIHRWAKDDPNGAALYDDFMNNIWKPAAAGFRNGDERSAMKILIDGFGGTGRFDNLPAEGREVAMQNSRFFKAATLSSDPFPELSKKKVKRLDKPILIITGENTIKLHKFINEELARLLPKAEQSTIPKAGHGSARENPQAFNDAVLKFLTKP
jgi:pimeloyl-ACP methyl ester carboxylesterase